LSCREFHRVGNNDGPFWWIAACPREYVSSSFVTLTPVPGEGPRLGKLERRMWVECRKATQCLHPPRRNVPHPQRQKTINESIKMPNTSPANPRSTVGQQRMIHSPHWYVMWNGQKFGVEMRQPTSSNVTAGALHSYKYAGLRHYTSTKQKT